MSEFEREVSRKRQPVALKQVGRILDTEEVELMGAVGVIFADHLKLRTVQNIAELLNSRFGLTPNTTQLNRVMGNLNIKQIQTRDDPKPYYARLAPSLHPTGRPNVAKELAEYKLVQLVQSFVLDIKWKLDRVALICEYGSAPMVEVGVSDLPYREILWTYSSQVTVVVECHSSTDALWMYEQLMHFFGVRVDSSYAEHDGSKRWDGVSDGTEV